VTVVVAGAARGREEGEAEAITTTATTA